MGARACTAQRCVTQRDQVECTDALFAAAAVSVPGTIFCLDFFRFSSAIYFFVPVE